MAFPMAVERWLDVARMDELARQDTPVHRIDARAQTVTTLLFIGVVMSFARDAVVPESWDCPKCGLPASLDAENPPPAPRIEPYKTHLAYVKERRSDTEAEDILQEAIQLLRSRRKSGEIIF